MKKKYFQGILTGCLFMIMIFLLTIGVGNFAFGGIGIVTGVNQSEWSGKESEVISKVSVLRKYIDKYFMEEVDTEKLADGIYKGLLSGLNDPYSSYYTEEEYKELLEDSSGTYCGIGAVVMQNPETGVIYIVQSFEGGSAYEEGITTGDMIYKVDGEEVTGEDLSEVVSKTKGKEGTTIEVEFYIAAEEKYRTVTLERRQIEVPTVEYEMKEDKIGYIAVSAFDEPTDEQFIAAIEDLEAEGMEGLIVDLRNNGGGMLETVVNMLDYMLPEGSTIVSTKDKNGKGDTYTAQSKHEFNLPLVILVNENTASASEVFSGAIKDYQMGSLVGITTFGKGIVQSLMELPDGTALKLTTSKYYTPDGKNIHKTGIEPDVTVEMEISAKKDVQYIEGMRLLKQKIEHENK